jgi:hypothetical protein
VSVASLPAESIRETTFPVRRPALADHDPGRPPNATVALDLGQKTGWAVCTPHGVITNDTAEFRPSRHEGRGMPYLRFRRWLGEPQQSTGGLGEVLYEEIRAHRGTLADQIYGPFLGHHPAWCESRAIAYAGVRVGTIKPHIASKGNATKEEVIAAVQALGFEAKDDNDADALALLDWALKSGGRR